MLFELLKNPALAILGFAVGYIFVARMLAEARRRAQLRRYSELTEPIFEFSRHADDIEVAARADAHRLLLIESENIRRPPVIEAIFQEAGFWGRDVGGLRNPRPRPRAQRDERMAFEIKAARRAALFAGQFEATRRVELIASNILHEQKRPRRDRVGAVLFWSKRASFLPRFEIRSGLLTFAAYSNLFNDAKRRRFSPAF